VTADPQELAGSPLLVRGEHHAEVGEHHVEGAVRERQGLGVALAEVERQAVGGGAGEQRGDVVDAGHLGEAAGRGERGVAVPARDVEHTLARPQVDRLAQRLADDLERGAHDRVVPRLPGVSLLRLDGLEIERPRRRPGLGLAGGGGGGDGDHVGLLAGDVA
jgi:hypothetical protein